MSELNLKIGDYTITDKDVDMLIENLPQEQQVYKTIPDFREQILDRIKDICLFAMLGKEKKMQETDAYKESMLMAERDLLGQLALADTLRDIEITDEEAKAVYDANPESFSSGAEANAKHILVDDEKKAEDIKKEIESESITFEDAAKKYSSCPSSQKGGDLGTFGKGQMVKEFEDATFGGELKTVIGPVKTQFGYHLIYVESRTEAQVPAFDDIKGKVKASMVQKKQQEKYDSTLVDLRERYLGK